MVIKTGKDGCFIKRGDMTMKVPAVAGITAIDTIGAGDNFASGFIAALLEGKICVNAHALPMQRRLSLF